MGVGAGLGIARLTEGEGELSLELVELGRTEKIGFRTAGSNKQ